MDTPAHISSRVNEWWSGRQERNYRLFYNVLLEYIEELLPVACFPTVARACQKYGLIFRRPRGLFITLADRGRIHQLLTNWPETRVKVLPPFPFPRSAVFDRFLMAAVSCSERVTVPQAIAVTDGERVLGLGDLGLQGMGIPVRPDDVAADAGGLCFAVHAPQNASGSG
jgi:malate dehydrogenase (oxaloacetate-decarboxylating)(NADP+)